MLYWPCWVGAWVKYRAVQNKWCFRNSTSQWRRALPCRLASSFEPCFIVIYLMLVALAWKATWECPYIYNLARSYHHSHVKFALQTVASPHKPKALRICGEQLKLCKALARTLSLSDFVSMSQRTTSQKCNACLNVMAKDNTRSSHSQPKAILGLSHKYDHSIVKHLSGDCFLAPHPATQQHVAS